MEVWRRERFILKTAPLRPYEYMATWFYAVRLIDAWGIVFLPGAYCRAIYRAQTAPLRPVQYLRSWYYAAKLVQHFRTAFSRTWADLARALACATGRLVRIPRS